MRTLKNLLVNGGKNDKRRKINIQNILKKNVIYNEAIAHPLRYHVKCAIEALSVGTPISLSNIKIYGHGNLLYCLYCGGHYSEESLLKETNEITKGKKK